MCKYYLKCDLTEKFKYEKTLRGFRGFRPLRYNRGAVNNLQLLYSREATQDYIAPRRFKPQITAITAFYRLLTHFTPKGGHPS